MTERVTLTLDEDAFAFLKGAAGDNRSAFINRLLKAERKRELERTILQANQEEAEDASYQRSLAEWDATLPDGLNS